MQIEDFQKQLEERATQETSNQKTEEMLALLTEIRDLLKTNNKTDEKTQAKSDKLET